MLKQFMKRMLPMLLATAMLATSLPADVLAEDNHCTVNVSFSDGDYKIYSDADCKVEATLDSEGKLPVQLITGSGKLQGETYYIKANDGYTIGNIRATNAKTTKDEISWDVTNITKKSIKPDNSEYYITVKATNYAEPGETYSASVEVNTIKKSDNITFDVTKGANIKSLEVKKYNSGSEGLVNCDNDGNTYTTSNYKSTHIFVNAKEGYVPELYCNDSETPEDYELTTIEDEDGNERSIHPLDIPGGMSAAEFGPEVDYNLGKISVSGNEYKVSAVKGHGLTVEMSKNVRVCQRGYDSESKAFDNFEPYNYASGYSRLIKDGQEVYLGFIYAAAPDDMDDPDGSMDDSFDGMDDPDGDMGDGEDDESDENVNPLNLTVKVIIGETEEILEPVHSEQYDVDDKYGLIYKIPASDDDTIVTVEATEPAEKLFEIPVQFNESAVKNFAVVGQDEESEYPKFRPYGDEEDKKYQNGVIEYTKDMFIEGTEATMSFRLADDATFVGAKGVYWRDNSDRDMGTFEKAIECTKTDDGIYTFKSEIPRPSVELEGETAPHRLEKIIIVAGKVVNIQFYPDLEIEPYKYNEEDDDFYLDEDYDPELFGHSQNHIAGETFYIGMNVPSNKFKLSSINSDGVKKELECVANWGSRPGSYYQIYRIDPEENVTIDDDKNILGSPKKFEVENNLKTLSFEQQQDANVINEADGTYTINKDGNFIFTLHKAAGKYAPKVSMTSYSDVKSIFPQAINSNNGAVDYSYVISYRELDASTKLYLEETIEEKKLEIEYSKKGVKSITVEADGETLKPEITEKDGVVTEKYSSLYGSEIKYKVNTTEYYNVGTVTTTLATPNMETTTTKYTTAQSFSDGFYAVYDTKVKVEPYGVFSAELEVQKSDGTWGKIEPDKATGTKIEYSMFTRANYRFTYYSGEELLDPSCVDFSKAKITPTADVSKFEYDGKNPMSIRVKEDLSRNGKLQLTLKVPGFRGRTETQTVIINVYNQPGDLVLVGKADNNTFKAVVDAKNYMRLKSATSALRSLSAYEMDVNYNAEAGFNSDNVSITLDNAKGVIIIPNVDVPVGATVATVKFHRKDKLPTDLDYYVGIRVGNDRADAVESLAIAVSEPAGLMTTKPVLTKGTPGSDDTSMTFGFEMSYDDYSNIKNPVAGAQYYEIKVVPKDMPGMTRPAEIKEKTFYIKRDIIAEDDWFTKQDEEQSAKYEAKCSLLPEGAEWPDYEPVFKPYVYSAEKLKVSDFETWHGIAWDYNVTISLVQTKNKDAITSENAASLINFRSIASGEDKATLDLQVSTYEPKYETNLGFGKKASKIYTGQYDAQIAELKFSKDTVCRDVKEVKDITECDPVEKLEVYAKDGYIYATVDSWAALGKHTIEVTPVGPEGMYQNSKELQVTVVRGIERIELEGISPVIYKDPGKAATASFTAKLNEGAASKAVEWKLLETEIEIDEESGKPLYVELNDKNMSIKNGKLTIKKDAESGQTFYVLAMAADYEGNPTYALSEGITLTSNAKGIATIKVLSYDEVADKYTVIGGDGDSFTTKQLENAYAVAFEKDQEDKVEYEVAELKMEALKNSEYTLKSGSAKVLAVEPAEIGYKLSALATGANIALTAQTTDGGKKKNVAKITVKYAEPAEMRVKAFASGNDISKDGNDWSFYGTVNTKVDLWLEKKDSESAEWTPVDAITAHKLTVKGGKILESDAASGWYRIVVTADKATVTFKDTKKNVTKIYTITNSGYSAAAAPKVKVENTITTESVKARKVDITIKPPYDIAGKSVMVELDAVNATAKKTYSAYRRFEALCEDLNTLRPATSTVTLNLGNELSLTAGQYKVVLTFGKMTENGFVADAKPVTATVTVAKPKPKKGNYVVAKSLAADAASPDEFTITGTGKEVQSVSVNAVYGANIKGKANEFAKYFEVKTEPISGDTNGAVITKICLKSTLSDTEKAYIKSAAGKNDRICFVQYTYVHGDDGTGKPFVTTKTTKSEIKY